MIPAFADGVLATMENQDEAAGQSTRGRKGMSEAQKAHIVKVRRMVEASHDMQAYDWRNILFQKKDLSSPHTYYVKASAVWIPYLIKRGWYPYCPICKQPVPRIDFRWVDQPMILFGTTGHRYLDTVRYSCACCGKSFRATNIKSLSLDKTGFVSSTFQVHLLKRCAVDQELYGHITACMMSSTSSIVCTLKDQTMKMYVGNLTQYYQVLLRKKAGGQRLVRQNPHGSDIVQAFARTQETNVARAPPNLALRMKQRQLRDAKLKLQTAQKNCDATIPLKSLRGIGVTKMKQLAAIGVNSAQDLLLCV